MLAEQRMNSWQSPHGELNWRYADNAMTQHIHDIVAADTRSSEYQAKLFGGGNMFNIEGRGEAISVCSPKITRGRELAATNNIPLVAEHVSGNGRLNLDLHNGHVWLAFPEGSNAYIRNSHDRKNQGPDR
jgi:chemotaxis protein CheD